MSLFKRYFYFILFFILFLVDQIFKHKIRHTGGFYVCNFGISFSIPIPFLKFWLIFAFFVLFGLWLYIYSQKNALGNLSLFGFTLILTGGLSNLFDRSFFGCVFDYISLGKLFPIFNLADVYISLGALFLLLSALNIKKSVNNM